MNHLSIMAALLFFFSPALLLWLVITILKNDVYKGRELKDDEHWGYQDETEIHSSSFNNP